MTCGNKLVCDVMFINVCFLVTMLDLKCSYLFDFILTPFVKSHLQHAQASMMFTCLEAVVQMRVVWRSSTTENGALFVMTFGT